MNLKTIPEFAIKEAKKLKADDVVVSAHDGISRQIKFVNNEIIATKTFRTVSAEVFLNLGKRLVVTNLEELSKENIRQTLKKLIKFAKSTKPKEDYYGIAEGPFKYKKIPNTYDKKIVNLNAKGADYVEAGINAALAEGAKRVSGVLSFENSEVFLATSNSVEASQKDTSINFSLRAFTEKNASGHCVNCARVLKEFDVVEPSCYAAQIAKLALNPKKGKAGKFDVVFDPLTYADFILHAAEAASITSVEIGLSFLVNKLGKKVANPIITLIDDGTLASGYSSTPFDSEGVPTQKNKIIDKGVLKTYLHNTSTARKYKTKTTANAGLIDPSPWTVVLKHGKLKKEELFGMVKRGLWITNNWYTRFQNYARGDFSTIPRDGIFLIENGEIKHPISDIRISDNMQKILQNTVALGKKPKQILSWEVESPVITPAALVKDVNITRSTK